MDIKTVQIIENEEARQTVRQTRVLLRDIDDKILAGEFIAARDEGDSLRELLNHLCIVTQERRHD